MPQQSETLCFAEKMVSRLKASYKEIKKIIYLIERKIEPIFINERQNLSLFKIEPSLQPTALTICLQVANFQVHNFIKSVAFQQGKVKFLKMKKEINTTIVLQSQCRIFHIQSKHNLARRRNSLRNFDMKQTMLNKTKINCLGKMILE